MEITKRAIKVEVEVSQVSVNNGQNQTTVIHNMDMLEGINVRFNITKRRGCVMNKAEIAICNLKTDTVNYLTTINALKLDQENRKVIRLFGGYEGKTGLLFEGDIIRALPSAPPDIWITANCLSGYHNNMKVGSFALQGGVYAKDVCAEVAKQLELDFYWKATQNKKIDQFIYQGGLTGAIEGLNQIGGIVAYQEDSTLIVEDLEPAPPTAEEIIPTYSLRSGLIGLPEPDLFGVKFKVLLDPTLKCGQAVRLESEQIPVANGIYYIYSLTHRGELRADPYYTELCCKNFKV